MFLRILISLIALAVVPALAAAEEKPTSDSYRKTLSTLLELTGADAAGEQISYAIAQQTLGGIAATGTQITEQIQQVVVEEAVAEFQPRFSKIDFLTNLYQPLYAEHLNEKELQELLAFYQSALGQKALGALPAISQRAAMSLQEATLEQIPEFQKKVDTKLRAVGIIVEPATP